MREQNTVLANVEPSSTRVTVQESDLVVCMKSSKSFTPGGRLTATLVLSQEIRVLCDVSCHRKLCCKPMFLRVLH